MKWSVEKLCFAYQKYLRLFVSFFSGISSKFVHLIGSIRNNTQQCLLSKNVSQGAVIALVSSINLVSIFGQSNLLQNGNFESGQTSWSGWEAGVVLSDINPYNGLNCAKFTVNSSLDQSPISVIPGQTYKLSAWIRINNMSGSDWGGIRFSAIYYNWSEWFDSDVFYPGNRPVGQWFNEVITFTPIEDQIRVRLGFFGGNGWTDLDFDYDLVVLAEEQEENMPPVIHAIDLNVTEGDAPLEVMGSINASDADGVITNYIIDVGDGGLYVNSPTFQHTYYLPGTYTLSVTVVDDSGDTDAISVSINVSGETDHSVFIEQPQMGGSEFTTQSSIVTLEGSRIGGEGPLFWLNNRTMQSGWVEATGNNFAIHDINLDPGLNVIHVQSSKGDGTYILDELNVRYTPNQYVGPQISQIQASSLSLAPYERTEIKFQLITTADNLYFPYDTDMPANLGTGSGVSVDVEFTNGSIVKIQPAFYSMDYERVGNGLLPTGQFGWRVRMAFKESGTWTSRIIARDSYGETIENGPVFIVGENEGQKGYLRVAGSDDRYFEYEDGSPFIGMGHGTSIKRPDQVDQEQLLWQENGLNMGRFWLSSSSPFSDAWSSWATHHEMENNGYMPPNLLSSQQRYGNGQFSWRLGSPAIPNQQTPAMFRGFWDGSILAKPETSYRLIARVRTQDLQGEGGLVIKTGSWLGTDVVQQGVGLVVSPYARSSNPWVYLVGSITTQPGQNSFDYIYMVLENCTGVAFVDQFTIHEIHNDGSLGQNILSKWNANSHHYLDPIKCREADYMIDAANERDIHYKVVIFEKGDYISNHIDPNGFPSNTQGNFNQTAGSPLHRLYEYYWRYLLARWGYATSIHSWELVNEGAPGSYFELMNDLADYFNNGPYPRMASTSFWSGWMPEYWSSSDAAYGDIHAYIMTTGWIDEIEIDGVSYNREALKNDAAAAVYAYSVTVGTDPLRNKPVIWGETDLDMPGDQSPDPLLAQDTEGVWLHNFNWAHINHGGIQGMIWDSENIRNHELFYRYRGFYHFMKDIPLNNGQYGAVSVTSTNPNLRAWGQIQSSGNAAHLWIQNRNHTWRNVLENGVPDAESGVITIAGLEPGFMILEWWNSWNEDTVSYQIDTVFISGSGVFELQINDLVKDVAIKMYNDNVVIAEDYDWSQFQKDAARTGRTLLSVPPPYRARWIWANENLTLRNQESEEGWQDDLTSRAGYSFPLPDTAQYTISEDVQAIVKGNRIYVGTMQGTVHAIDLFDGSTLWTQDLSGGTLVSAAVLENRVVFAGLRGMVAAFDTLTGDPAWTYSTRGAISSAPLVLQNSVIIANHKGRVVCLEADGSLRWDLNLPVPVVGGIAGAGNLVYIPAENMTVYAIDVHSGAIVQTQTVRGQSFRLTYPVVSSGRVWVTSCPVPMVGSEYVMEDVISASSSLEDEITNTRRWLTGDSNGGQWAYASTDWQNLFALDVQTLASDYVVAAGPIDGVGSPPPCVTVDNQNRILRWFKTRFPFLTGSGPAFGTPHTIDISGVDPLTGDRVPIDNGQLANMWLLETDNTYGLSVGGDYLWLRQHFRGTQVINLINSNHDFVVVPIRSHDGGNFSSAHVCYTDILQNDNYLETPFVLREQPFTNRTPAVIAGNYIILAEDFGIVVLENYEP